MQAITVKDLKYEYIPRTSGRQSAALDRISFAINEGEFVAVVGRNGSGKSTLARHLNGLLVPMEGTVCIYGKYTNSQDLIWDIRRTLGMVFQNPDNQLVATTVEEDVAFGPENLGMEPERIESRVVESLEKVNMLSYREYSPYMLSGGQKQRVAIAGVLAMHPRCIVLDEATSMLDPEGRQDVMAILKKLNRDEKITIVLITHHMNEAAQADRIIVMDKGKAVFDGKPGDVFKEVDLLRRAGLDVPQVSAFYMEAYKSGIVHNDKLPVLIEDAVDIFCKIPWRSEKVISVVDSGVPSNAEPVIEINNLSHIYMPNTPYEKIALKDVSLTVYKGEMLAIIGHTGSGKSTLVQHLNGLLTPTKGSVRVSGIEPKGKALKELRKKVGLIFQNPEDQLFEETVRQDIGFGLKKLGISAEESERRIKEVMKIIDLPEELLNKSPFELSGGQKRRIAIAGVIVMEPEILILDEPTAGLDPKGSMEVYGFLLKLRKEKNTTIIVISHLMEDIARYFDRVAVMDQGEIVLVDSPRNVFTPKEYLEKIGLDVPQITELFYRINQKYPNVRKDILTVDEGIAELKRHNL
ncbi:MAG: energy-coupling factor transporter ATPase [Clostridiaceae bacterium]|nr:energy-coupling factor transporter ATPase [Clostridiaceae bacterium]